jgi:uncharacterized RDD family membrane protein YckC
MKSLEEITFKREINHVQIDNTGIERFVTNVINQKLSVKTINAGLRFVHLIVDYFIFAILLCIVEPLKNIDFIYYSYIDLIIILLYPLLYTIMEYKFQKTPGKFITGYRVIDKYANKPCFKTCLLRTLIRFVPFEALSCMSSPSRGWHDEWSHTYVVSDSEAIKLKEILDSFNKKN